MSVSSPGGPSSTMFATGPYAHETQLVTPPVFSTFTTEPSTAPFTPPPELAHLTTPSSPDVPYAHFLSSAADLNCAGKNNYVPSSDLQTTYPLSPGSPASSLRSPVSRTSVDCLSFPERERHIAKHPKNASEWLTNENGKSQASNFFCPATFAQFYLDQPHSGGRLSISKESDNGTVNQSKQNKNNWQDAEELEAYRASFGFSADEMITTPQYVEISDVMDDSFTMVPCTSNKSPVVEATLVGWGHGGSRKSDNNFIGERSTKSGSDINGKGCQGVVSSKHLGGKLSVLVCTAFVPQLFNICICKRVVYSTRNPGDPWSLESRPRVLRLWWWLDRHFFYGHLYLVPPFPIFYHLNRTKDMVHICFFP